jgi:hypothetical protein
MASSTYHAFPYCVRGYRFTLPVVLLDADGDPTAPSGWDSEISTGGGAFADCTEEVVAPSGAAGEGYLTLTGDETNTSLALLRVKDTGASVKTSEYAFVPAQLPTVETGTAQAGASNTITLASGASGITQFYRGMLVGTTGGTGGGGGSGKQNNQLRVITSYNNSTKVATVFPQWETTPDATTTYEILLASGNANVSVGRWLGTDLATPATAGYPAVTIKVGTGTGELDLVSGAVKLASAAVQALWDALTSAMTTAGSIGKKLADWALGSDSKVLLSANAQTGVTIPSVTDVTNVDSLNSTARTQIASVVYTELNDYDVPHKSEVDSIVLTRPTAAQNADAVWDEARSGHTGAGSFGEGTLLADGAIASTKLDSSMNTYQAKVWLVDDDVNTTDRYVVAWFRNSQPVTSGITSPTIRVVKAADGSDLVASTPMTQVGSTGLYRYSEATSRIANGAAYFAEVIATIDSATRTWYQPIGRDS